MRNWRFLLVLLFVFSCVLAPLPATAASFPARDITLVVPWAPGGATDTLARLLAAEVQKEVSRSVVVLNKAGGNGAIGDGALDEVKALADIGTTRVVVPAFLFWQDTAEALARYGADVIERAADL